MSWMPGRVCISNRLAISIAERRRGRLQKVEGKGKHDIYRPPVNSISYILETAVWRSIHLSCLGSRTCRTADTRN